MGGVKGFRKCCSNKVLAMVSFKKREPTRVLHAVKFCAIKGPCFIDLASGQVWVFRFGSNDLFHLPGLGTQFAIARKQIPGVIYHRGWLHLKRKAADV